MRPLPLQLYTFSRCTFVPSRLLRKKCNYSHGTGVCRSWSRMGIELGYVGRRVRNAPVVKMNAMMKLAKLLNVYCYFFMLMLCYYHFDDREWSWWWGFCRSWKNQLNFHMYCIFCFCFSESLSSYVNCTKLFSLSAIIFFFSRWCFVLQWTFYGWTISDELNANLKLNYFRFNM